MKKTLLTLTLIIVSQMTFAYPEGWTDWKHINLEAQDGTKIAIDYKLACFTWSYGYACEAADYWVNVTGEQISSNSEIRVVHKNFSRSDWGNVYDGEKIETDIIDLDFQEGRRFSNTIGLFTNVSRAFQEISVVVDGKWLVDPISNTGDFRFSLF